MREVSITCGACKNKGAQDKQYPQLCSRCGGKLRAIDAAASNPVSIRGDMLRAGIPLGGSKK